MVFTARLKRTSSIWHMWRTHRRVGGVIAQVQFKWVPGDNYVTGELDPIQMAALRAHADVELEMSGGIPEVLVDAPLPQESEAEIVARPKLTLPPVQPVPVRQPPPSSYQHGNGHHKGGRR